MYPEHGLRHATCNRNHGKDVEHGLRHATCLVRQLVSLGRTPLNILYIPHSHGNLQLIIEVDHVLLGLLSEHVEHVGPLTPATFLA